MAWVYHNKPPMGWPLDLSEPINDGLVGYWLFNEGSGNKVFDLSENGHTGTFQGTAPSWTSGKFGSAVLLPGTDESIDIGTSSVLDVAGPFTLSVWIKYTSSTPNMGIVANFFPYTKGYMIASSSTAGRIVFSCYGSGFNDLFYTPTLNDGIWHHIVGVDTGVGHIIYIDGVYGNSDSNVFAKGIPTGETFEIGDRRDSGVPFNGQIDNVAIWNRALSASEIALLYQFPFYGFLNPDEIPVLDQYYTVVGDIVVLRRRRESA